MGFEEVGCCDVVAGFSIQIAVALIILFKQFSSALLLYCFCGWT
jgi:hypothetical protein